LSGGESQRLMLARAYACAPDLMLVDEPTAQLDRASSNAVVNVLSQLAGRGCLVVIATHDPQVRDACTDVIDLGAA
jgi:ABC-type lipoprotein export system ATPase subunit